MKNMKTKQIFYWCSFLASAIYCRLGFWVRLPDSRVKITTVVVFSLWSQTPLKYLVLFLLTISLFTDSLCFYSYILRRLATF